MKRILIFLLLVFGMTAGMKAKVVLPNLFSDNMVLQQNTSVNVWGWAKAGATVSIKSSWSGKAVTVRCDKDGRWTAHVATPKASYTPQTMTFGDGENSVKLQNILIGEVWVCTGQSNMEITLNGFWNCPIAHANEMIAEAGQYTGIRCLEVEKKFVTTPRDNINATWMVSNAKNAPNFSAAAYNFAIMVNKVLNVPVGILVSAWGGSTVEGWLPENILKGYKDIDLNNITNPSYTEYMKPEIMYNAMLRPIAGYTARGFLWYQGESNVGRANTYADRLSTMVNLWRNEWGQKDMPFYIVEIAPFQYGDGDAAAYLREAQYKATQIIPNSGIVSTNDLVEPYEQQNIHPRNKKDIGYRLAYLALSKTYKVEGIEADGPSYKSMEVQGDKAILSFNHMQTGFNRMSDMEGFEMAGADKVFHPAAARMVNNLQIEVTSKEVPVPVAVRYCFRNFQIGNVASTRELPLFPFRTDNW
jgi:sialate O-acetylesterase